MAKKITDLTALTSADPTDVVPIVDISTNTTKKTTVAGLVGGFSGLIDTTHIKDGAVTPAKMLGIDLFAATAPVDGGTAPTAGSGQFYLQAGFTTVNFPGGGFAASVTFPTPFPNGLLSLTWSYASSSASFEAARTTNETKTGFTLNSGSGSAQHEICYIAIGW